MAVAGLVDLRQLRQGPRWDELWHDWAADWRHDAFDLHVEPPTWVLGDLVRAAGHPGIVFPSLAHEAAAARLRAGSVSFLMRWQDHIVVDPEVRGGKPCIKGTRITVYDVLEYLAGGMSEDEILRDFPDLTREDIRASLAFAAARERRLASPTA